MKRFTRDNVVELFKKAGEITGNREAGAWEMSNVTAQALVREFTLEGALGKRWCWAGRRPTKIMGYRGLRNDGVPHGVVHLVVHGHLGKPHFRGALRVVA